MLIRKYFLQMMKLTRRTSSILLNHSKNCCGCVRYPTYEKSRNYVAVKRLPSAIINQVPPIFISRHYSSDPSQLPEYGKYAPDDTSHVIMEWISNTSLVQGLEQGLIYVHDATGAPWWLTIVLSTFTLRLAVTTPLTIYQMYNNLKYRSFTKYRDVLLTRIKKRLQQEIEEEAKTRNWDARTKNNQLYANLKRYSLDIARQNKAPGMFKRSVLPWAQLPLWICMSISLRDITLDLHKLSPPTVEDGVVALQLSEEGLLWFQNLCLADPYYVLPALMCLVNLGIVEVYKLGQMNKPLAYIMRGISVLMLPIACYMPSAVTLYWLISSSYGGLQAVILMQVINKKLQLPSSSPQNNKPNKGS